MSVGLFDDLPEAMTATGDAPPDELGLGQEIRGVRRALKRGTLQGLQKLDALTRKHLTEHPPQFSDARRDFLAGRFADQENALYGGSLKDLKLPVGIRRELFIQGDPNVPMLLHAPPVELAGGRPERLEALRLAAEPASMQLSRQMAERQKQIEALPPSPDLKNLETDFWKTLATNPVETVATIVAESLPQTVPGMVAGAVAGPPGAVLGAGANSFAVEYAGALLDTAQKDGVDLTDPEAVEQWFSRQSNLDRAHGRGLKRGIPIAILDAASAGLAGRFLAKALGQGARPVVKALLKDLGVEMGAGMLGETTAQLASEGKITSFPDIILEGIAELGTAPGEFVGNLRDEARPAKMRLFDDLPEAAPTSASEREATTSRPRPGLDAGLRPLTPAELRATVEASQGILLDEQGRVIAAGETAPPPATSPGRVEPQDAVELEPTEPAATAAPPVQPDEPYNPIAMQTFASEPGPDVPLHGAVASEADFSPDEAEPLPRAALPAKWDEGGGQVRAGFNAHVPFTWNAGNASPFTDPGSQFVPVQSAGETRTSLTLNSNTQFRTPSGPNSADVASRSGLPPATVRDLVRRLAPRAGKQVRISLEPPPMRDGSPVRGKLADDGTIILYAQALSTRAEARETLTDQLGQLAAREPKLQDLVDRLKSTATAADLEAMRDLGHDAETAASEAILQRAETQSLSSEQQSLWEQLQTWLTNFYRRKVGFRLLERDLLDAIERATASDRGSPLPQVEHSRRELIAALERAGIAAKSVVTAGDMAHLRQALKKSNAVKSDAVLESLTTFDDLLTAGRLKDWLDEYLSYLPPQLARSLPKLKIAVKPLLVGRGQYSGWGHLDLAPTSNLVQARRTLFHELTHWVHLDGPPWYREVIRRHFEARTAGEQVKQLKGHRQAVVGKKDNWYDSYAGRIYPDGTRPVGSEIPTRYMELLLRPDTKLATYWNDPSIRETLLIVLRMLF